MTASFLNYVWIGSQSHSTSTIICSCMHTNTQIGFQFFLNVLGFSQLLVHLSLIKKLQAVNRLQAQFYKLKAHSTNETLFASI